MYIFQDVPQSNSLLKGKRNHQHSVWHFEYKVWLLKAKSSLPAHQIQQKCHSFTTKF